MKTTIYTLLFYAISVVAQDGKPAVAPRDNAGTPKGQLTVQGCVTRSNGDYILIKQDPGDTYELQASGKLKLHSYLGQRVEVTGKESPSLSTSSDAITRAGSASPVTITVSSIKMIDKECPAR
jgi:hypothetical protein